MELSSTRRAPLQDGLAAELTAAQGRRLRQLWEVYEAQVAALRDQAVAAQRALFAACDEGLLQLHASHAPLSATPGVPLSGQAQSQVSRACLGAAFRWEASVAMAGLQT